MPTACPGSGTVREGPSGEVLRFHLPSPHPYNCHLCHLRHGILRSSGSPKVSPLTRPAGLSLLITPPLPLHRASRDEPVSYDGQLYSLTRGPRMGSPAPSPRTLDPKDLHQQSGRATYPNCPACPVPPPAQGGGCRQTLCCILSGTAACLGSGCSCCPQGGLSWARRSKPQQ